MQLNHIEIEHFGEGDHLGLRLVAEHGHALDTTTARTQHEPSALGGEEPRATGQNHAEVGGPRLLRQGRIFHASEATDLDRRCRGHVHVAQG